MSPLYVSDLDGTLLRDDATLSDFSQRTLQDMVQAGLIFTVASARSVASMRAMLAGLKLALPVIEFNGAFLSDLMSGRHEVINEIASEVVPDLASLMSGMGFVPFISTFNGSEDRLYCEAITNEGMSWYHADRRQARDERLRPFLSSTEVLREQIICFTVIDKAPVLRDLEAMVVAQYAGAVETHLFENRYSPGWYWLTIHDYRATKDQAILVLRDRYGLSQDELVVFGDQINDLKMFALADRAVAVANALPSVQQAAHLVIGSNQNDSVAKYLLSEFAGSFQCQPLFTEHDKHTQRHPSLRLEQRRAAL